MKEFNNRAIANKHAEYITGKATRKYLANKVAKYLQGDITVFDGAVGSGQLEEYIKPNHICGVDIQEGAIEAFKENYKGCEAHNMSFFKFDTDNQYDAVIMNPPFSIPFKDLPEDERELIQKEFSWKKSGKVDDIFVLKSLKYTKRFAFYILFPGVGYRRDEKKMREIIGNHLVECNMINNGFDDTSISVMFLVIDKEKTSDTVYMEEYDAKIDKILTSKEDTIDPSRWEIIRYIDEKPKPTEAEVLSWEINIRRMAIESLKGHIMTSYTMCELDPKLPPLKEFIKDIEKMLKEIRKKLNIQG